MNAIFIIVKFTVLFKAANHRFRIFVLNILGVVFFYIEVSGEF